MLILKFGHVKMVSCKRGAFNDTLCLCNLFRLDKKRNNCNLQEQGVFYTCFVIQSIKSIIAFNAVSSIHVHKLCAAQICTHTHIYI